MIALEKINDNNKGYVVLKKDVGMPNFVARCLEVNKYQGVIGQGVLSLMLNEGKFYGCINLDEEKDFHYTYFPTMTSMPDNRLGYVIHMTDDMVNLLPHQYNREGAVYGATFGMEDVCLLLDTEKHTKKEGYELAIGLEVHDGLAYISLLVTNGFDCKLSYVEDLTEYNDVTD